MSLPHDELRGIVDFGDPEVRDLMCSCPERIEWEDWTPGDACPFHGENT